MYLILGLIVILVVLETFCELQQLKQLRKMFYLKKESKAGDRLAILEHDHLAFTTVSESGGACTFAAGPGGEGKVQSFLRVPVVVASNSGDDPMIE